MPTDLMSNGPTRKPSNAGLLGNTMVGGRRKYKLCGRRVVLLLLGVTAAAGYYVYGNPNLLSGGLSGNQSIYSTWNPSKFPGGVCDPTTQPGSSTPQGLWSAADPECIYHGTFEEMQSWLWKREPQVENGAGVPELGERMPWIRNTTILFYGDSVTRHLFEWTCFSLNLQPVNKPTQHKFLEGEHYSEALYCTEPSSGLTLTHHFSFGNINYTDPVPRDFIVKDKWPAKEWSFEWRLPNMVVPNLPNPDIVIVGGGAWDFKYWYRRDLTNGLSNPLIPKEDLEMIAERQSLLLDTVRGTFPKAKMVWLEMQRMRSNDLWLRHEWAENIIDRDGRDFAVEDPRLPPMFTPARLSQHQAVLRLGAKKKGLDTLDYWELANSFDPDTFIQPNDCVHPDGPARQAMMGQIWEKIWRFKTLGV